MTSTTLTWIGILSQAIPAITAILMVTVGNCIDKRKQDRIKNLNEFIEVYQLKIYLNK